MAGPDMAVQEEVLSVGLNFIWELLVGFFFGVLENWILLPITLLFVVIIGKTIAKPILKSKLIRWLIVFLFVLFTANILMWLAGAIMEFIPEVQLPI